MNHWRGVWSTLDVYTGTGWMTAILSFTVGVTGFIGLKAFRNLFAPPFVIIVDDPDDYFTSPTAPDVICYHSSHYYVIIIVLYELFNDLIV